MMINEQKKSLSGCVWQIPAEDERAAGQLSQKTGLPYFIARIMTSRGIGLAEAENFLQPRLQSLMPDPSCLKDMDKAAERLAEAVKNNEKIGIIGDYDVDGATSSAVLKLFFESLGIQTLVHIPDRDEGYGPGPKAFEEFEAAGIKLVITVDCGTAAYEILDKETVAGFEIIVLDHHEAEARLPKVIAVVNPKRLDETGRLPYLAAVGVAFLTVVAINRALRRCGFYQSRSEPDLLAFLDLVALGTVCDVVPLLGLNRAFVRQGLKVMAKRQNLGLKTLIDLSSIDQAPTAFHLGFVLGPRINAGGRVGEAATAHRLLCAHDPVLAQKLADNLNKFNAERKDIEAYVLLQAMEMLEGHPSEYPIAFAAGRDWHQGVIGIVAGKLKERYNLPSFVMSIEADEVKGSARSVPGVDLGALIVAAKEGGLLTKGGGHTMAAGFSLTEDKLEDFRKFAGEWVLKKLGSEGIAPVLNIEGILSLSGATLETAEYLAMLEPFGAGNPEPKILIENVKIINPSIVGSGHVRCFLGSDTGGRLKAMAFRAADTAVGQAMLNSNGEKFDLVGLLRKDTWQGKSNVQFLIEDMMRH